jgi:hypothetical protein
VFRSLWKIYYTFVITGAIAGTVSYGVASLVGPTPFVWFFFPTFPLILVFCLAVSLPLAGIAFLVFRVLEAGFGPRPRNWWRLMGAASGLFFVTLALLPVLSIGALGSAAGRIFWSTFLVAGTLGGAFAATAAQPPASSWSQTKH